MSGPRYDPASCPMCLSAGQEFIFAWTAPSPGEKDLGVADYYREIWRCRTCGHVRNFHEHDLSAIYEAAYNKGAFEGGLKRQFDRVMALPREQSDNWRRVGRIVDHLGPAAGRSVLDIGTGSAVFPAAMRETGWIVTAMDPDRSAAEHARREAKVEAFHGDVMNTPFPGRFDLVTFNKVLEHIADPVAALIRAKEALKPSGTLYVELPDGEEALHDSIDRQEFFLEHWHAFSLASIALLARRAGLRAEVAARSRCPSGKYTLHAFMRDRPDAKAL